MSTLETFPSGAGLLYDEALKRWAVFLADGSLAGYRKDESTARAFAASLAPMTLDPIIEPHALSWSPRAKGRAAELGVDVATPVPEPVDGGADTSMSEARRRSGAGPSDRPVPMVAVRPREGT
jgi:hypothetical protein